MLRFAQHDRVRARYSLGLRTGALFLFAASFVLMAAAAFAAEVIPPKPAGYFNDYAGVVPKERALQLNEKLAQFERETSVQIVVAVFRKMDTDSSIEEYTRRVARAWDIGQKETNNGAALFAYIDDRKMFIQTARGLEGALPDAICFDITHNVIAPYFRKSDYAGGLTAGIDAMMQAVRGEYKGSGKTAAESRRGGANNNGSALLFVIIFIIFMIMIARASRKRGRGFSSRGPFIGPFMGGWGGGGGGWSGGGSPGGGFSGFSGGGGGGGFGGGGAGSSW